MGVLSAHAWEEVGRAKGLGTYFEHNDMYNGHDCSMCMCVKMSRCRDTQLGIGKMYKELESEEWYCRTKGSLL